MKNNFKYLDILNIIKYKNVELRHDVDVSIKSSYRIAKIETENNIKSIFYIRFDSDYYNPLSKENKKIVDFLISNHEIGCHVDATSIRSEEDLKEYLDYYNKILPFNKFTFHINTEKTKSFGIIDKYDNKSILNNRYISDSKNIFTQKDIQDIKELDNYTLLIHPEWWDNKRFIFGLKSGQRSLLDSLELDNLFKKSLKEILGADKNGKRKNEIY